MATTEQWQVAVGDKRSGPFSFDQLAQMISQGRIPRTALVWKDGMNDWRRWTQLPEFADLAVAAADDDSLGNNVVDILMYRRMTIDLLVHVVFWVGVLMCIYIGFSCISESFEERKITQFMDEDDVKWIRIRLAVFGLGMLFIGPLFVRVQCEFIMIVYRAYKTLTEINQQLKQTPAKP